ncbi:MAG: phage tail protein [Pseudobdellovibrionaceae bacterium]
MAVFDFIPDNDPVNTPQANVIEAKFGDSYSQRQQVGINAVWDSWSLSFSNRPSAEGEQIIAFLKARGGVEAFDFTPPYESTAIRVVCRPGQWSVKRQKAGIVSINAKFEQVFEP